MEPRARAGKNVGKETFPAKESTSVHTPSAPAVYLCNAFLTGSRQFLPFSTPTVMSRTPFPKPFV
jgi:hypothetical protein